MTSTELNHRLMWGSVAGAWREHAAFVDARLAPLTERMLDAAGAAPGARALELGCGAGGLGLAALGRGCEVVLSDVAPEMVEIAAARAGGRAEARVLDLDAIAEPDDAYDVVLCRDGLQFARDPRGAAAEIARVLRPGGRFAIGVWAARERNPWLSVLQDVVSAQIGRPVPPPGVPGPFGLSDSEELSALLGGAAVEEVALPYRAATFEEWRTRTLALAGPLARVVAGLPADAADALRHNLRAAVKPYKTSGGLVFPGVGLLASGSFWSQ
jgi:enediyne biosynthesis protein CalE5